MAKKYKHKRSWKNFLLDVRYQITFSMPMVVLAAFLFAGLGYLAMSKVSSATKIGLNQIEQTGAAYLEDASTTRGELLRREDFILYGIIGGGVVLCLGLFLFGVVTTHRVAGPLYRLRIELDKIAAGKHGPVIPLRKGDQLTEFYAHFEEATKVLRENQERDVEALRAAVAAAQNDGALAHLAETAALVARLKSKEASLA